MRPGYRRREPERTLLHATVRTHLKTFLAEMEQRGDGAGLPGFVISEFERYLACGDGGLTPVRRFRRSSSPTVLPARAPRPAATRCWSPCPVKVADSVLPAPPAGCRGLRRTSWTARSRHVAMRQWVLSLPRWARFLLARNPLLVTRTLDLALRAIFTLQRGARGGRERGKHLRASCAPTPSCVQRWWSSPPARRPT